MKTRTPSFAILARALGRTDLLARRRARPRPRESPRVPLQPNVAPEADLVAEAPHEAATGATKATCTGDLQ